MARKSLFKRIAPGVRALDTRGHLEAFLSVLDDSFDVSAEKIRSLVTLHDVDNIEDRYLPLLGPLLGHRWRSAKSYDWNRSRIRDAFLRHSYKSTNDNIEDLLIEHGAQSWEITDMASRLDIWNRQGGWNRLDGVCMGDGLYHEGSYLLEIDDNLDFESFLADFEEIKPEGTVWYFNRSLCSDVTYEETLCVGDEQLIDAAEIPLMGYERWNMDEFWHPLSTTVIGDWGPEDFGVEIDGGLLFANSNMPVSTAGLTVDMGTRTNPLELPLNFIQDLDDLTQET